MVEKDILFSTKVKYNGPFNWKELYKMQFEWFLDQGYDISEKTYKEIILAGGAKEIQVEWEAWRKVSDYFRFYMYVRFEIFGMTNVEVDIDGNKVKMNKGQLEMTVKITLEKDYENRWISRPAIMFLRTFYDRYLIKERIERFEEKLILEMDDFANQAKTFLNMGGRRAYR